MKCPKCKADVEDGINFCPQCGSDLQKSGNKGKKPGGQQKDEGSAPNEERAAANPDGQGGGANESGPETGTQEAKSSDPEGGGDKGGAGQPPKASTSGQAEKAAAPRGRIGGGFLAAVIAVAALAAIGVGCGIVHTVIASASASSSQESGSDLASGGSSAGSYGGGEEGSQSSSSGSSSSSTSSSSSPSSSATSSSSGSSQAASGQGEADAVSDLASAQNCSGAGGSATLQSGPSSQSAFTVSGTSAWGPILTCVAQQTSMPSSEEAEIRSFVNQAAANSESGSSSASPQTVSWGLGDKSEIYATFAPSPGGQGGWSVGFADTRSASAADFQDLQSEDQGSDAASQGSDAVSALQNSAQQCSADAGESDLQSNPSGPDMLIISGQSDWGSVLACVARHTSMPAADQAKIKSFVDAVSSDPNSGQSGGTVSWSMKDGSKIYTSYDLAASQPGAWIVDMGDEPSGGAN
ncbi:MAG: zinc ribbon domain-containing protein [Aeriscardovia sp.]|nr:zinc ribbon domain-containing protein [Aeriscardovia sp.]